MAATGFLSRYLSGPLPYLTPYNRKPNVLSASLNKTFHSFLPNVLSASLNKIFPSFLCNLNDEFVLMGTTDKMFDLILFHFII